MSNVIQIGDALSPFYELLDDLSFTRVRHSDIHRVMLNGIKRDLFKTTIELDENMSILVSTIFLGVNMSLSEETPVLFETMIIGGSMNGSLWRYTSYAQSNKGHSEIVQSLLDEYQIDKDDPRVLHNIELENQALH